MAGEGGFKSALNGFDKNEVNEYISNLRTKMKELEAEKRTNDEKTAAAVKIAQAAEDRIKAAEERVAEKVAELELQAKTERRNAESLTIQIDELKRKLKHQSAGGGSVDTSAAQKQSAEIIAKANKTAQDIVEKAKKTAQDIIANAQSAAGAASARNNANTDAFMSVLKSCLNSITASCGELGQKASELLGASGAPVTVQMPDLSNITAPSAPAAESAPEISLSGSLFDNTDSSDDDMMSGFGAENTAPAEPAGLDGFDLSNIGAPVDEPVETVAPIDTDNVGRAELNNDFMKELIAQTVPSSALGNEVDGELLAAVKEEEAKYAVQPADEDKGLDFDMGASADDPMAALLAQAQAAFGGGGGFEMSSPEPEREPEPAMSMGSSGDWADLQKQLEAMEQSGNFGDSAPESAAPKSIADDPKAPSADDSAIWNFGDMSSGSSDDDDMSSDLFGSF
ncbi:MAG: hypothetical protein HDT43_02895 [Ruminococcaceae bacterium]|nr:hypothetical protein [Oscillospiraceae bacterium]